jgi:hypothetical protein
MNYGLRVGYGPQLKSYSATEPLVIKMEQLKRVPLKPVEEARLAARDIADKLGRTPWVCLSGGLDSEATAYAFLSAGVDFKAVTMQFEKDLNHHEVQYAIDFCKQNGVKHELIEIPVLDFYETQKFQDYFHHFKAQTVEVCTQFYFLDQFTEPFVWSGEPMRLFRQDGDNVILQAVSDFEQMVYRYGEDKKRDCVPNFHFYSAELAWSFLRLSVGTRNEYYVDDHVADYYLQKNNFYRQGGFLLNHHTQRVTKAHGFEHLKIYFDDKYAGTEKTDYNSVYRKPWKDLYPTAKQNIVDIPKSDTIAKQILRFE